MPTKNYSIRFDPDLMARFDARPEGRSEFIRAAAEAALGLPFAGALNGPAAGAKKKSFVPPDPDPVQAAIDTAKARPVARSGRQADAAELLAMIRSKRLSPRQAEAEMGWLGLRYGNAEKLLLSSGAAVVVDGVLVAT
jgi:hypothetical protein